MSVKLCIDEVLQAAERAGRRLTNKESEDLLKYMQRGVKKRANGIVTQSMLDALFEEGLEAARRAKVNAAIIKRNRLINAKKYLDLRARAINAESPRKSLTAILVGDLDETVKSGGVSVDATSKAILNEALGGLAADLERSKTRALFGSGQIDDLIYRELFDGFGSTKNKQAETIAKAIRKTQRRLLKRKNRAGANITDLPEYVVRQSHDIVYMRKAGQEQWVKDTLPLLDDKRTFKNLEPGETAEDFLKKIYNNLITGNHMKTDRVGSNEGLPDPDLAFKGPANLAKQLSQDRVLHFKNGESAYSYATKYSRSTLAESVSNSIAHDGQSIALMETFGTNPRAMFDRILQDASNSAKEKGQVFNETILNNFFKELDGTTRAVGTSHSTTVFGVDFASIGAANRAIQNMSKLGFATLSSFSDIASNAAVINRATGRGLFRSYASSMTNIFSQFGPAEQKELGYLLSVGVDGSMGSTLARISANDSIPGTMGKLQDLFFKLNLMQWWNNSFRKGLAQMLSADLALATKKGFANINKQQQQFLSYYGIGSDELDLFRDLDMRAVDGRDYLTPEVADSIPNSKLDKYIASREPQGLDITDNLREEYRDKLRTGIARYYTESADTGTPVPGARERAYMNWGTMRGTVPGEAFRAFMQFKAFPITFVTKGLARQFYGKGGGASGTIGVVQTMIGMTVLGYLSESLREVTKGKEPRLIFDEEGSLNPDVLKSAFIRGGGAGIYGDLLFGEYNKYGQGFLGTFAGPTLGQIDSVAKIYGKFRDGDPQAIDFVKFAASNTPFINLFYTKAAIDYLFMYGIAEWDDPGKLRKLERKIRKEEDREFLLPPSEYAIQF